MVTVHIHLCLQAVVFENLAVPLHESSVAARNSMELTLKSVCLKRFEVILSLVSRPPIVMINHDRRFIAHAHRTLSNRQVFIGCDAIGAYLALELRMHGCIVVHGSSFWCKLTSSLRDSQTGSHILSTDKVSVNEPHQHHRRGFAIYEKQLFYEKMISACYLNSESLSRWQNMLHRRTINVKCFREIWMDSTKLLFSSTVDTNAWISSERRQAIEDENRPSDFVRRPGMSWQNFDISLQVPEPSYSDERHWFKIDECSQPNREPRTPGKTFFCRYCEGETDTNIFCRNDASFKSDYPQFPEHCVGCTYKYAFHNTFYQINNYKGLRESEKYSLACARYIYIHKLENVKPGDDLVERVRQCCPIAYMSVGKVVSAYGGIWCHPANALAYPTWGKASS